MNDHFPASQRIRYLVPSSIQRSGKKFSAHVLEVAGYVSPRALLGQLVWEALFRGIQTYSWFVAFELICRYALKDKASQSLLPFYLGVLLESTPRGGSWFSNHPALRKTDIASRSIQHKQEQGETLLERITRELKPTKPTNFLEVIFRENVQLSYPKAVEVNFIGVGYKDHGSLGDPSSIRMGDVPLSEFEYLSESFRPDVEKVWEKNLEKYLGISKDYVFADKNQMRKP